VLILEECQNSFQKVLHDLCVFLGVDPELLPAYSGAKNTSGMHKIALLSRLSAKIRENKSIKKSMPSFLIKPLRYCFQQINKANTKPWTYPKLTQTQYQALEPCFSQDISKLETLLGKKITLWKRLDN
jgi:hypothetical protein